MQTVRIVISIELTNYLGARWPLQSGDLCVQDQRLKESIKLDGVG